MSVRVSEGLSMVFGNWLLVACVLSLCWYRGSTLCPERDISCFNNAAFFMVLSAFACVMPLLLWIIFTIYAVASNKEPGNKRIGALRFALIAMPCLFLVWAIAAFITDYQISVTAIALCLVLAVTDILYVRALVLEHKV